MIRMFTNSENRTKLILNTTSALTLFALASTASAQETAADKAANTNDRIMVIGSKNATGKIPGSAYYVGEESLEEYNYSDVNRILREVPGVNVQDEEGYGLRPNIGFRGGRVDRSSNITLMEDGVLIAPAPYASPSAYYFPEMQRFKALEVRKGSSSVKYGPRTTNGVLNLVTHSIPNKARRSFEAGFGSDNAWSTGGVVGDSFKNFGYVVSANHRQSDGFKDIDFTGGDTGYEINDVMTKFRFNTDASKDVYQSFEFKVGRTQQISNSSYLGLTQADFDASPNRRYVASALDEMDNDHQQFAFTHYIEPTDNLDITTTVYHNDFARDWFKVDKVDGGNGFTSIASVLNDPTSFSAEYAALTGANSGADAIRYKHNNREYESYGIQTVVGYSLETGSVGHEIEVGGRWHRDEEDRFQWYDDYQVVNGALELTSAGTPGTESNRISRGQAYSFFIEDTIEYDKWTFVPGLRYEHITLSRNDYGKSDVNRTGANLQRFENEISVFIPGLGVIYDINNNLSVFGGVHKGFAPPGVPGNTNATFTEEEESINYELGARYNQKSFNAELVGFFNDYSNLLGEDTFSSGGTGNGDAYNGGEVDVYGLEFAAGYDLNEVIGTKGYQFPILARYTWTQAEFNNSFDSDFSEWGTVTSGDELPYIAEHQLYIGGGVKTDVWSVNISGKYTDEMRTTAGQGGIPAGEGTDSSFIVDVAGDVQVHKKIKLFGTVENLFDKEYVVARRPAGARPGKPLTFFAGVKFEL